MLVLEIADALLYLTNVVAHVIERATDMAQMFKNDVVSLCHGIGLSQRQIIVNYAGQGARPDLREYHEEAKATPELQSQSRGTEFWETHDSSHYIDWSKVERVRLPNLKPSTTAISIRLPMGLPEQIKIVANKLDVPCQSLIKMWLAEKVG